MESRIPLNTWVRTGGICGLIGGFMYLLAAFVEMHPVLTYIAAYSFPLLLAIGCTGLFFFFSNGDDQRPFRAAWVSGIAGGLMLIAMLTVQQSIFSDLQKFPLAADGSVSLASQQLTTELVNGLHLAWVILVSLSMIFFSHSMRRQSWTWKFTGTTGLVLGVLLLLFNLYSLFTTASESITVSWGQLVAIWLMFVFATLLTSKAKLKHESIVEENPAVSRATYGKLDRRY